MSLCFYIFLVNTFFILFNFVGRKKVSWVFDEFWVNFKSFRIENLNFPTKLFTQFVAGFNLLLHLFILLFNLHLSLWIISIDTCTFSCLLVACRAYMIWLKSESISIYLCHNLCVSLSFFLFIARSLALFLSKTTCSPRCSNRNCCTLKSGFVFYTEFFEKLCDRPSYLCNIVRRLSVDDWGCYLPLLLAITGRLYWLCCAVNEMLRNLEQQHVAARQRLLTTMMTHYFPVFSLISYLSQLIN